MTAAVLARVESRTGAFKSLTDLRFQSPLIEPDVRISRIRLSDKTSCVRPRKGLGQGFGLQTMRYRAEGIGARLVVQATRDRGTELTCELGNHRTAE